MRNKELKLNSCQKEAIFHKEGPCLVIAGAGSGKTRVLTERIATLIESGIAPYNILAITFTNKAASEMKQRVNIRIGDLSSSIFIGTFHSFGLKILRENYDLLGFTKNITIIDREDQISIIKKLLKENGYNINDYDYRYILNRIGFAKNSNISSIEFRSIFKSDFDEVSGIIYQQYEQTLKENNTVDFDDLLLLPLKLFGFNKEILDKYSEHFKYILVDEYQDTNTIQYEFCHLLSLKYKNIFVVGDMDQNIYSFRNATYENIMKFENDYKDIKVIMLEENYRSTKYILEAANSVIKNNSERKDKKLWTSLNGGEKVKYICVENEKDEAEYIVKKVKELANKKYDLKEIGVLYRTNAQSRTLEDAFLKENIPYKVVGSYYFYNRKEIKDLIAYLNLIYNTKNNEALERIINVPKRSIGTKSVLNLRNKSKEMNLSMFESIDEGKHELEFKKIILHLIECEKVMSLSNLIDEILIKSGMKDYLINNKSLENDIRLENLEEFKSIAISFEERGIYSLEEFLENIALVSDAGLYKDVEDAVNLMTIHSAKGLEFDAVFIPGMEEGIFPHIRSFDNEKDIEEERRLCYVGMTRAKEQLYMISSRRRLLYGKVMGNPPSRFIDEIDKSVLESEDLKIKPVLRNTYKTLLHNDENFRVGDKVNHRAFGAGIIVSINGGIASIAFNKNIGIKQVMTNHSSLSKREV